MADKVTVIGSPVSPYVRKVLVCLELKGIACEIDPPSTRVDSSTRNPFSGAKRGG